MARRHRREGTSRNNPALKPPSLLPSLSRFTLQPRAHPGAHVPMALAPAVPPPGTTLLAEPQPCVIDQALTQGGRAEVSPTSQL